MSSPSALPPRKALETPPSSDIEPDTRLPPSPPLSPKPTKRRSTADRIVRAIRSAKAGRSHPRASSQDWTVYRLSGAEFQELEQRLQEQDLWRYYEDKVRYEDEPEEARFILRMPSALHELVVDRVEQAIKDAVAQLVRNLSGRQDGDNGRIGEELQSVFSGRSTLLELHAPKLENSSQETDSSIERKDHIVRRSPDATFYHPAQPALPTVVLEVSYSQQGEKDLPRLADSYIVDSRHAIRCVIGVDIPYAGRKKASNARRRQIGEDEEILKAATVSVWRPAIEEGIDGERVGVCTQDMNAVPFRTAAGQDCDGTLDLSMSDILPSSIASTLPHTEREEKLIISLATLASALSAAEQFASSSHITKNDEQETPARFRKRKRTPSEELSDTREEMYIQQEEAELEREKRMDGEFRARKKSRGRRRAATAAVDSEGEREGEQERLVERRRRSLRSADRQGG